jgi:hypothetical protein
MSGPTAWVRGPETPLRAFLPTESGSAAVLLVATLAAVALPFDARPSPRHRRFAAGAVAVLRTNDRRRPGSAAPRMPFGRGDIPTPAGLPHQARRDEAVIRPVGSYPSPTVLVDDVDVMTGSARFEGVSACRLDLRRGSGSWQH